MSVHLHIERLVLDGLTVSAAERDALGAALAAEMSRLIGETNLAPMLLSGGAVPALPAPALSLPAGADPAAVGGQIARAVYAAVGNNREVAR